MITIDHLREAWTHALVEINVAITYLESGLGMEASTSNGDASRAADAWLVNLRHDRIEYDALLSNFRSMH